MPDSPPPGTGSLVLTVRCATDHRHRVGDVHRFPDGTLLWRGRLPRPGPSWDPADYPDGHPPLTDHEQTHWSERHWHTRQPEGHPDTVAYWGCRCTGEPQAVLWDDVSAWARDPSRRDVALYT